LTVLGLPRAYWPLWLASLVNSVGVIATTMLAVYFVQAQHMSAVQAARVHETWQGAWLLAGPIGGALSDHFGRRPILLVGLVGSALGMCALRFIPATSASAMMALLVVTGACGGLHRPAFSAAVADLVRREDRQRAYAFLAWTGQLGLLAAAALPMLLGGDTSPGLAFLIAAAAALTAAGVIFAQLPETRERVASETISDSLASLAEPFVDVLLVVLWALSFLLTMIVVQDTFLMHLDREHVADAHTAISVAYVVLQPIAALGLPYLRRSRVLATTALLVGLGIGLNGLLLAAPRYDVAAVLRMLATVAAWPAAMSIAAELAPAARRGVYLGVFGLGAGVATSFGTSIGGQLADKSTTLLWTLCLAAGAIVAVGHMALAEARRRRTPA
jgi:MFS family permease